MTKTVAVTGANGFLGYHIASRLLKDGYNVRCLVRNKASAATLFNNKVELIEYSFEDLNSIKNAIRGCNIIIHVAAIHSRKLANKDEVFNINVAGTKNLIESASSLDAFVFISSIRSMMTVDTSIIDETTEYNFAKYDTPYGASKYEAEKLCIEYHQSHKLPLFIINPAVTIGPEDFRPSPNGELILEHLNKKIVLLTKAVWSIVDVRDVADSVPFILKNGKQGEKHIVCSANMLLQDFFLMADKAANKKKLYISVSHPVLNIAALIFEMLEKMAPSFSPPIVRSSVKVAKLMTHVKGDKLLTMGFKYRDIKETIYDTVQWFLNNKLPLKRTS